MYAPFAWAVNAVLSPEYTVKTGPDASAIYAILRDSPDDVFHVNAEEGFTVSGVVAVAGAPIEGARVILMTEIEDTPVEYAFTDSAGKFAFHDLNKTREFYVIAKPPSGWQNWEYRVSSRRKPA